MAIYQVGEKVLGFWGAMHPLNYGKIEKMDRAMDGWFRIRWNDGHSCEGFIGDIFHDAVGSCGVGIYFCAAHELNQYPDEWFEVKVEEDVA